MTNDPTAGRSGTGAGRSGSRWTLLAALVLLGGIYLLVWARYQPPAPRPASAPAGQFSAVRAEAMLRPILGDEEPHPVGSAADARVREAIVSRLRSLGYQPEVRQAFACSTEGVCGQVRNVLARLDGSGAGKAVLVAAHYDSVPAGPGASDDGAGIAAELEIARALKTGPAPKHAVIFLFDEGEEAGLLGAVAFVEQNVWAREVGAAVNLEARGTSGPSLMFETGSHSLWLMPLFARAVPRPLANSLYYAVYRRLPNDTDFSIFKKHGFDGFNFAFIGDVTHYHTPLDNLNHFDTRSLQSQGEHALGLVRALANAKLGAPTPGGAVFFDVAAWRMVWWPLGWSMWLAGIAVALLLACVWVLLRRGALRWNELAVGLAVWPMAVAMAAVLGILLRWALREVGAAPSGWVAHPWAVVAAFWLLGIGSSFQVVAWLGRKSSFWALWCGCWFWWAVLSFAVAVSLPEASFLWLVPALAAGVCGMAATIFRSNGGWITAAVIVPAGIGALLTFEVALLLYPALGATGLPIVAALLASVAATLGPLIVVQRARICRGMAFAVLGMTIALGIIAGFLPPYSAQSPQRLNFIRVATKAFLPHTTVHTYATAESGKLPPTMEKERVWLPGEVRIFPWSRARGYRMMAKQDLDATIDYSVRLYVHSESVAGNRVTIAGVLKDGGVPVSAIAFPPEVKVDSFRMEGQTVPPLSARAIRRANGWHQYVCVTTPAGGVSVGFTVEGPTKFEAAVMSEFAWRADWSAPPVRPPEAVASQSGDLYVFVYPVHLGSAAKREDVLGGPIPRYTTDP